MHEARGCWRVALSVGLWLAAGCSGPNAPVEAPAEETALDGSRQQAIEIAERMLARYREAQSYSDSAAYVEESVLRGEGVARELPYYQMTLAFVRPNRVRLSLSEALADADGRRQGFDAACDGRWMRATLLEMPSQVVERPAPSRLTPDNVLPDPLIREKLMGRPLGEVLPQLAMLLAPDDENSAVFPEDENPRLLAGASLGGRACHRVATTHPEGTRVLWIDCDTFVLRRIELPVETHRRIIDPDGHFLRFAVRIDFEEPTFDAELDEAVFALPTAAGTHRVRRFVLPTNPEMLADAAAP